MTYLKRVIPLLAVVCLLASCASIDVKPWSERTPQEKAQVMMELYNSQYADAVALASTPGLTESQKQVVRTKTEILKALWPAVKSYDDIAVRGEAPGVDLELLIIGYLDNLARIGGK